MTPNTGKQSGPEPYQFDPYDGMSDEEFVADVQAALKAAQRRQTPFRSDFPRSCLSGPKPRHASTACPTRP